MTTKIEVPDLGPAFTGRGAGVTIRKRGAFVAGLLMTTALVIVMPGAAWAQSGAQVQNTPPQVASSSPLPAPASDQGVLKDVVVTARHRHENVQKVPLSISVLSGSQLDKTGTYTLVQIQHSTPNVVNYNSNSRNSSIAIRGVGINSASDGLDTTVGVYVDGVYLGRPGMALTDLIDIDQIEVLRGPQGTLWGRNTAGGALNITTEEPSFTPGGSVEASVGNYGYGQERATVTGPVNDKIAIRITAFNTDRNGWLANSYEPDRPDWSVNRLGARVDVLIQPNPDLTITLRADYAREQDSTDVSVISGLVNTPTAALYREAYTDVAKELGLSWRPVPSLDSAAINSAQNQRNSNYGTSGTVEWHLDGYTFTSITAWRGYFFSPLQDSDGSPLDIIQVSVATTHDNQFSQEFRVTSPTGGPIDWQAGTFLFHQRLGDNFILDEYGSDATLYYNTLAELQGKAPTYNITNNSQYNERVNTVADSEAIFGQGTWHVTSTLDLTGGARLSADQRYGTANSFVDGTIEPASLTPVIDTDANIRGGNLSGTFGASYKIGPDSIVYANFADGYQSGGLNLNSAVPADEVKIKPVIIDNYEVGIKETLFNNTLILDADAYLENIYDYQANISPVVPPGEKATSYLANIKGIRTRGFELDSTWEPAEGLLIKANGSYDDADYSSYHNGLCPIEYTGTATSCDETGRPVYMAPRWIGNLTAEYSHPIKGSIEAYGLVQYSYTSGFFGTADDSEYSWQNGYEITNLRAGVTWDNGKYDVSMWGNNVFNTRYFVTLGASAGWVSGELGEPATFGATGRVNF